MSLRALLALLLALLAALALLKFLKAHAPKPASDEAAATLLAPFLEAGVRRIELACGEAPITLERTDPGRWRLTRPLAADADPRAVHTLVAALQDARVKKVIAEASGDEASFGLAPPTCEATLALENPPGSRRIRIGRTSPIGVDRYARDESGRIVFVDGALASALGRTADALREKRLVPVDAGAVTRVELVRPDGSLILAQEGERWRLLAPIADQGGRTACEQLVRSVVTMELSNLRSVPVSGGGPEERRIALRVFTKDLSSPIEAFVAAAGIEGKRLAWREGGAFGGLVEERLVAELTRPAEAYRDDQVTSFSAPDVRLMRIERRSGTVRIERKAEGSPWSARDGEGAPVAVDAGRVDALVDSIRWLRGSGFVPDLPGQPATGTIVVQGATKELARLRWGALAPVAGDKESVWVVASDRPGAVFRIAASAFGPMPARAADLAAPPAGAPTPRAP